jgi:hypothetical protein
MTTPQERADPGSPAPAGSSAAHSRAPHLDDGAGAGAIVRPGAGDGEVDSTTDTADGPAHERDRDASAPLVVVAVSRTGGFAGLTKHWRATATGDAAARWRNLIADCPWDEATGTSPGADRYVWIIDARDDGRRSAATLGDAEVEGPWRALIDAVRDSSAD